MLDEIRVRLRKAVVSRLQSERPGRLTKPLRRLADGSFQRVDRKTAIRLQKRHGIRALRHEPKPSRINEYSEASSSGISRYIDQLKGDNMPSREALENWANNYVELWNKGEKEAWVENWQKVAPGAFTMMDPVGTPPKHDFVGCCVEPFDLFQPSTEFRVDPATRFICGNEVAWVMENIFSKDGQKQHMKSIETYIFGDDGSVEIRTHYDVPDASDPISGGLFSEYLPE